MAREEPQAAPRLPQGPSSIEERSLVDALRAQNDKAYETLVRTHGGRLLQVARRFVGEEEARDAVQEAFLSAFKSIDKFDGKARLSTWLHRIVVNACLMRLRRKSHQLEQSLEPFLPRFLEDGHRADPSTPWPESPEDVLGRNELRSMVRRGIDELPTSYRSVILLRDIEGFTGIETAEMLGLTPNAVKVRLHRARIALREILDPQVRRAAA